MSVRQHPGFDHCIFCTEDADYSAGYSLFPRCCCRSVIPLERFKSRLTDTRRDAFVEAAEMLRREADRVAQLRVIKPDYRQALVDTFHEASRVVMRAAAEGSQ